jgi:adenylylsulfate kinase-like enzyme
MASKTEQSSIIDLIASISTCREDLENMCRVGSRDFIKICCNKTIEIFERRVVKGFYKKAHAEAIAKFAGISSSYKILETPEFTLNTGVRFLDACVHQILQKITSHTLCALSLNLTVSQKLENTNTKKERNYD